MIGGLFVYAGAIKIVDPKAFARTISHWDLVPEALLPVVAIGLPIVEILAGLAFLLNLRFGLPVIAGLLVFFVCVLGLGVSQGLEVDCGCFGADEIASRESLSRALYRDLVLFGGVLFLFCSNTVRAKGNQPSDKTKTP